MIIPEGVSLIYETHSESLSYHNENYISQEVSSGISSNVGRTEMKMSSPNNPPQYDLGINLILGFALMFVIEQIGSGGSKSFATLGMVIRNI